MRSELSSIAGGASARIDERSPSLPDVAGFYDTRTSSIQYVVSCPSTGHCAVIDPVLDFDPKSGSVATRHADAILAYVAGRGLTIQWILDTHPHADHLSALDYFKQRTGAATGIGARIVDVQALWADIYGWSDFRADGSQWDRLFDEDERFAIGNLSCRVLFSPGHTLASVSYLVGDAAFIHDTLFMPDTGSARADFPGGSAYRLYASIREILALPDATRLFTGHDYRVGGREARWESTVLQQKAGNIHFAFDPSVEAFVALRTARDRTLPMPQLILHALQVNVRAGRIPEPDSRGRRFLSLPLNAFGDAPW